MVEAGTVIEAATVLSAGPPVHLVFSDVDLPGATGGLSLAVWINAYHPNVPVILTSGVRAVMPTLADQRRIPFIPKPYDFENVAALIAKVIAEAFHQRKPDRDATVPQFLSLKRTKTLLYIRYGS